MVVVLYPLCCAGPVVSILHQPAATFGLPVARITMSAVWASGGNSSLQGAVVQSATFQVQNPGSSTWQPVCADAAGNCNGTCTGAMCTYSYTQPSLLSVRAMRWGGKVHAHAVWVNTTYVVDCS